VSELRSFQQWLIRFYEKQRSAEPDQKLETLAALNVIRFELIGRIVGCGGEDEAAVLLDDPDPDNEHSAWRVPLAKILAGLDVALGALWKIDELMSDRERFVMRGAQGMGAVHMIVKEAIEAKYQDHGRNWRERALVAEKKLSELERHYEECWKCKASLSRGDPANCVDCPSYDESLEDHDGA